MTEKEAKKKWCPFSSSDTRHCIQSEGDNPSIIYVGPGKGLPKNVCIASACMMWRWSIVGATVNGVYDDNYPVEGYCGLGGKLK